MNKKTSNVFRGLSNVFVSLLCMLIVATMIAESLKPIINTTLGTTSLKVVVNEDGSTDTAYYKSEFSSITELLEAREAINEQVVEEGAALLKNLNSALPLSGSPKVTFLGMGSHQSMYGSAMGNASINNAVSAGQLVTYEEAFNRKGFEVNPTMIAFYEGLKDEFKPAAATSTGAGGYTIGEVPMDRYTATQTNSYASYHDAAIIFLTRNAGEGADITYTKGGGDLDNDKDALQVQSAEWALINHAKDHFDKIIIFINSNNPIACGDLQSDPDIDAIVWTGGVGTNTNYSLAMMIGNDNWDDEGWDLLLDQMSLGDYVYFVFGKASNDLLNDPNNDDAHEGANVGWPGRTGEEGPTGMQIHYVTEADHADRNVPYYITAGEENMEVDGVKYTDYWLASMHQQSVLAATFNPALARRMGEIFGEDTLWAHGTSHEIGANNHRSPFSGRNNEYYSEDGNLAYIMGYEECAGIESKGGRAMPKHYVGNDQETNRQGLATFGNEAAFREIQLRSVEGAFRKAGAKELMGSFSRYGVIQAAYSKESWDVLREEWGHPWVINVTDMAINGLQYGVRSIISGTDSLLAMGYVAGEGFPSVVNSKAAKENPELANALRQLAKRHMYCWANTNDANGYSISFIPARTIKRSTSQS